MKFKYKLYWSTNCKPDLFNSAIINSLLIIEKNVSYVKENTKLYNSYKIEIIKK